MTFEEFANTHEELVTTFYLVVNILIRKAKLEAGDLYINEKLTDVLSPIQELEKKRIGLLHKQYRGDTEAAVLLDRGHDCINDDFH